MFWIFILTVGQHLISNMIKAKKNVYEYQKDLKRLEWPQLVRPTFLILSQNIQEKGKTFVIDLNVVFSKYQGEGIKGWDILFQITSVYII